MRTVTPSPVIAVALFHSKDGDQKASFSPVPVADFALFVDMPVFFVTLTLDRAQSNWEFLAFNFDVTVAEFEAFPLVAILLVIAFDSRLVSGEYKAKAAIATLSMIISDDVHPPIVHLCDEPAGPNMRIGHNSFLAIHPVELTGINKV